ncbi:MAG TPA: HEAT repeat domain-containing protein [Deltaproteobacteria bacterium]|nr:HEAT repeat domain-containing protein [Deltaproteobacteria bacterium]
MATHATSEPPLQPLAPPEPWRVAHHTLRALEPDALALDHPHWGWFTEDLLRVVHPSGRSIDVGWLPDGDPRGRFRLTVLQDSDWRAPVHTETHRSLAALLGAIEAQLASHDAPGRTEAMLVSRIHDAADPRDAIPHVLELRERGAVDALVPLLADPRHQIRYAAVDALAALGDATAGDALLARFLLPEPDLGTRKRLIDALGAVGHRPAAPVLARWLSNPDADQRIAAARALVRIGAIEALDAVQEAYATERSRRVRPHLKEALQQLAGRGAAP